MNWNSPLRSTRSPSDRNDLDMVSSLDRRTWFRHAIQSSAALCGAALAIPSLGCTGSNQTRYEDPRLQLVYARSGWSEGRFEKPRAIEIDSKDQLYIVDMTGRVQVFDTEGKFLRYWKTPAIDNGKPSGLGIDREGNIMVADTHYYRVLFYTPEGEMLDKKTIGGTNGKGPGEFGFVTDVIQDSKGNYFVSEYGEFDRIQKFSADGEFICQFGRHGDGPIEFNRPQSMVLDENDHIWVADAHNHRIQVLRCPDREPELLAMFGEQGKEPGKFMYPYGIDFDHRGNLLISEYGNHRIQRMTQQGQPLEQFGKPGRLPGELNQPWGCIEDSKHRIHILDSKNHRIQRIAFTS